MSRVQTPKDGGSRPLNNASQVEITQAESLLNLEYLDLTDLNSTEKAVAVGVTLIASVLRPHVQAARLRKVRKVMEGYGRY